MFYYPEVLRRHTGCFGTIWLAATCSSRLLRREFLGVDVPRACAAVESFLIGRGGWEDPPPPAGAPPPRCSLYLAALLQLGLARVHGRQRAWLLEEAAQVLGRLHRARPPPDIDLSPPRRPQLVPDARALMAALELAPDPFFGVMGPGLPSPTALPPQVLLEELPPPGPPLTVSPEIITLREPEPLAPPALEEELPEVTARELELLAEAEAELLPPVEKIPELPPPPPPLAPRPPEEPPLPPPPEAAPPPPRRRRRPPPHVDPQPQIPQAEFGAQLLLPHIHCRDLPPAQPPPKRRRPPAELFRTPAYGWLPPELWELWGRCARPPSPPPAAPPAPPELPSEVEVLREAVEPSLPPLPSLEVSLEVTEEEPRPPEERRPPPPLPELPEPPPGAPLDAAALRRLLAVQSRRPGGAELAALLPHGAPRVAAARLFYVSLELCGAGWLRLEQARPYGPIAVGPGPRGPPPPSPAVGQGRGRPSPPR